MICEGTSLEFFGLVLAIPFCLATKDSDSHPASPAEWNIFLWGTFFLEKRIFPREVFF